jgi:phosphatidylinositol alpha-1,6-mannosyltransferase
VVAVKVLIVSKPVVPPFHDGSKSLVLALCSAMEGGVDLSVLGAKAHPVAGAKVVGLYPSPGQSGSRFAPSLFDNAKALAYLGVERQSQVWHFVFAPNPRAAKAIRQLRRVRPRPSLQTIASPPRDFSNIDQLLFGDVVVAQSEWTRRQILAHSERGQEVTVIYPPLRPPPQPSSEQKAEVRRRLGLRPDQPMIVFPGDLEFGGGAERCAAIAKYLPKELNDTQVVLACRHKTAKAQSIERQLRSELRHLPITFSGELPSLFPLLAAAEAVVFPVADLFGKVDLPISLLEAAALGVPVVVADDGPASEVQGAVKLPIDDSAAWVSALVRLSRDEAHRTAVCDEGRAGIAERHAAPRVASRYAALYRQLARRGSHR